MVERYSRMDKVSLRFHTLLGRIDGFTDGLAILLPNIEKSSSGVLLAIQGEALSNS